MDANGFAVQSLRPCVESLLPAVGAEAVKVLRAAAQAAMQALAHVRGSLCAEVGVGEWQQVRQGPVVNDNGTWERCLL